MCPGLNVNDPNVCIIRNTSSMFGDGFVHARMQHFTMDKSGLDISNPKSNLMCASPRTRVGF